MPTTPSAPKTPTRTYQPTGKIPRYRRPQLRAVEAARVRRRFRLYGPTPKSSGRVKAAWRRSVYGTEQLSA